jgi:hypothetical protein
VRCDNVYLPVIERFEVLAHIAVKLFRFLERTKTLAIGRIANYCAASALCSNFKRVSLEKLDPDWVGYSEEISEVFCKEISDFIYTAKADEYELEHFAVYLVFRYFLTAVFDYDLLTKAKFTVLSIINICRIQAFANASDKQSRVEIMQKYSKEVEHSANNLETLNLLIKQSKYYSVGNLINILEMIK